MVAFKASDKASGRGRDGDSCLSGGWVDVLAGEDTRGWSRAGWSMEQWGASWGRSVGIDCAPLGIGDDFISDLFSLSLSIVLGCVAVDMSGGSGSATSFRAATCRLPCGVNAGASTQSSSETDPREAALSGRAVPSPWGGGASWSACAVRSSWGGGASRSGCAVRSSFGGGASRTGRVVRFSWGGGNSRTASRVRGGFCRKSTKGISIGEPDLGTFKFSLRWMGFGACSYHFPHWGNLSLTTSPLMTSLAGYTILARIFASLALRNSGHNSPRAVRISAGKSSRMAKSVPFNNLARSKISLRHL